MHEAMTEEISYNRGYDKGWADAQERLAIKYEKALIKAHSEAYEKGYQAGANQMSNDPCLCGFWGKSNSNKSVEK